MFGDNQLSVWAGLRPCVLKEGSKLRSFQDCDSLMLSGNQVLKRFHGDLRPDESNRGVRQCCDRDTEDIIVSNMTTPTSIIVKKVLVELSHYWHKFHITDLLKLRFADQRHLLEMDFPYPLSAWGWQNYWQNYQNSINCTVMNLPSSSKMSKAPIMREEAWGQPGTQKHCFNSHWMSWLWRDFSSLRDTMDTVKSRNNDIQTATQQMWKAPVASH